MPSIIQKSAQNTVLGQKWAVFCPIMSQKCPKLFLYLSALRVDEVCKFSPILDYEKINAFNISKIATTKNCSFWAKMGHFSPQTA